MTVAAYRARTTEAQMEDAVRKLVALNGGRLFHLRDARQAPELEDLQDWLIVAPWLNAVVLAEAKSAKRRITPGQQAVIELCRECWRFESFVVRSVDPKPGEVGYDDFLEWLKGE